jgi:hypothetical protein
MKLINLVGEEVRAEQEEERRREEGPPGLGLLGEGRGGRTTDSTFFISGEGNGILDSPDCPEIGDLERESGENSVTELFEISGFGSVNSANSPDFRRFVNSSSDKLAEE